MFNSFALIKFVLTNSWWVPFGGSCIFPFGTCILEQGSMWWSHAVTKGGLIQYNVMTGSMGQTCL